MLPVCNHSNTASVQSLLVPEAQKDGDASYLWKKKKRDKKCFQHAWNSLSKVFLPISDSNFRVSVSWKTGLKF